MWNIILTLRLKDSWTQSYFSCVMILDCLACFSVFSDISLVILFSKENIINESLYKICERYFSLTVSFWFVFPIFHNLMCEIIFFCKCFQLCLASQITDLPPGRIPVQTFIIEGNDKGLEDVYKVTVLLKMYFFMSLWFFLMQSLVFLSFFFK